MAITTAPAASLADSVKKDITSPNTTTASTLKLLRALLGLEDLTKLSADSKTKPQRDTVVVGKVSKIASKPARPGRSRTTAKVAIYATPDTCASLTSNAQRLSLATETFNKTLKVLSSAVKSRSASQAVPKQASDSIASPPRLGRPRANEPLQECSPNRQSKAWPPDLEKQKTANPVELSDNEFSNTAKCAQTALDCLRDSRKANGNTKDTQLEKGSLVLLENLNSLELTDLAVDEIYTLRAQLESKICAGVDKTGSARNYGGMPHNHSKHSLVETVRFAELPNTVDLCHLVISFQRQVLRTITLLGSKVINQSVADNVRLSSNYGPYATIVQSHKSKLLTTEKTAAHLHALAQMLFSLCHSTQIASPPVSGEHLPPELVFDLELIALEYICTSWTFEESRLGLEMNVWMPFKRIAGKLFQDVAKAKAKAKPFGRVWEGLQRLENVLKTNLVDSGGREHDVPSSITKYLAQLAEECGCDADALNLLQRSLQTSDDCQSLSTTISRCDIAILRLQAFLDNPGAALAAAEEALACLKGPMKGSARELENMLLHGVRLRKAALATFSMIERSSEVSPLVDIQLKVRLCSVRIIFAFLHFVLRYIGLSVPGEDANPAVAEHFHQKVHLSRSIAESTISNVLLTARASIDSLAPPWIESSLALDNCLALAGILEQVQGDAAEVDQSRAPPSTFIKVSNLYWSQYLKRRESGGETNELLGLLGSATEVLKSRSEPEQRLGFLATKYEKIAAIHLDLKSSNEAREALKNAICSHVLSRPVQDTIRHLDARAMRCFWDDSTSAIFALGKTLTAYIKLCISSHRTQAHGDDFYDDKALSEDERSVFLRKQFDACIDAGPASIAPTTIVSLASRTLTIYSTAAYTLHRLQFLHALLKYASKHDNELVEELLEGEMIDSKFFELEQGILKEPPQVRCGRPLLASLRLQWLFKTSRPSVYVMNKFMSEWSEVISDTQTWQELETQIDDPDLLPSQVQSVIDFADMQGYTKLRLNAVLLQRRLIELQKHDDTSRLATCLVQISLQYIRSGDTVEAGRTFVSAEKCIARSHKQPLVSLQYHLAHAEYFLSISNVQKSFEALEAARLMYAESFTEGLQDGSKGLRLIQNSCLCQSALLVSKTELERGDLDRAILSAKHCIKLTTQTWAGMQKVLAPNRASIPTSANDSTIDSLVDRLSSLDIAKDRLGRHSVFKGAAFWPYVRIHHDALIHMSLVSAHCGLFQDAIYYADQAHNIGKAVGSHTYAIIAETLLCAHRCKGRDTNIHQEGLAVLQSRLIPDEVNIGVVSSCVHLAEAYIAVGEHSAAVLAVDQATQFLSMIHTELVSSAGASGPEEPSWKLNAAIAKATWSRSQTKAVRTTKATKANRAKTNKSRPGAQSVHALGINQTQEHQSIFSIAVKKLEVTLAILRAEIELRTGNGQEAMSLLAGFADGIGYSTSPLQIRLLETSHGLSEALKELAADAVHCVLAETTIAYPSVQRSPRLSASQQTLVAPITTKPPGRARKTNATSNQRLSPVATSEHEQAPDVVRKAMESLFELSSLSLSGCPTNMLRELSLMLDRCFMLSSVLCQHANSTPIQVALQALVPRSVAMSREHSIISTDMAMANRSRIQSWPEFSATKDSLESQIAERSLSIQTRLVDVLPANWTIVSVRLSHDADELSITKLHVGQTPFSLRIPLRRSSSEEPDAEDFDFASAKTELLDIIKNANLTAHDSRDHTKKEARKSWWAEREALDQRLNTLLDNIENIWLGGFRGVLSHQQRHQDLLSRLSGSLLQSLNQHLPSRQKNQRATSCKIQLHAHVLDLFVALGHPDNHELDDSISDLLYFVVDILQFQGEHNAYDEIDFDMIIMEVQDALRCYHEALRTTTPEPAPQHIILVLDKELLAFPWESLPCLEGQAICRMPSVSCIKSRLDRLRMQSVYASALQISKSVGAGAYILNPSSDLISTQKTFASAFSTSLPHFTSITNRPPTETEFESCLHDNELFLYFGHGSGAQYIRGRNVKRLQKCAVTFLMGCSSAKMNEAGAFEPWGVPWNYMHGGAAAVVGTLWDVTDKDIDRFAMRTFVNWGLVSKEVEVEAKVKGKEKGKGKGKQVKKPLGKAAATEDGASAKQAVALDEAVANARDVCVLRYLNGAAPVIYGIPVVLD